MRDGGDRMVWRGRVAKGNREHPECGVGSDARERIGVHRVHPARDDAGDAGPVGEIHAVFVNGPEPKRLGYLAGFRALLERRVVEVDPGIDHPDGNAETRLIRSRDQPQVAPGLRNIDRLQVPAVFQTWG